MTETRRQFVIRTLIRPWSIGAAAALLYALLVVAINDGDPLALVTIGTEFSEGISEEAGGTEGYDGQFVYIIAKNPAEAGAYMARGGDVPAYRFQRALLPALGRLLAFGSADALPWSLLGVNVLALAAGTAVLEVLLTSYGVSRWYALSYALSLGALGAARLTLPEPLAYGLALIGLLLTRRDQPLWSAFAFALAALAKETTLIIAAGCGLYLLLNRRPFTAVVFGLITLLPFAAWQIVLMLQFGEPGIGSGGAGATGFTPIPFGGVLAIVGEGVVRMWQSVQAGDLTLMSGLLRLLLAVGIFAVLLVPFALYPTVWGLIRVWRGLRQQTYTLPLLVLLLNAGVMLFVPFSTYREIFGILRFIIGLEVAVLLFAAEQHDRRMLRYSTLWIITMLFLAAPDLTGGSP